MASQDLHNVIFDVVALESTLITTVTPVMGFAIDTKDYEAVEIVTTMSLATDGQYQTSIFESDDDITYTQVSAEDLIGITPVLFAPGFASSRIGYKGKKRYVKANIVAVTPPTIGATLSATAILGHPRTAPTPTA